VSDNRKRCFLEAMDALKDHYVGVLQRLVRTPSPVGEEGAAQEVMAQEMRAVGLEVDVFEIDRERLRGRPDFVDDGRSYRNRPNVVGVQRGNGGARSFLLNAHIDCAPVDGDGTWQHEPYSGEIADGKLHGRGAWDDKAGCMQMLWIVAALKHADIAPRGDVTLMSVIEDEMTGNGTLACVDRGYLADGAVILDGTWNERIIHAHMGQLMFRVVIDGDPAPAVACGRGTNPIHAAMRMVAAFDTLTKRRNDALTEPWGRNTRPVFINVGRVASGVWAGAIPQRCVLEAQYGFLPPTTVEQARRQILDLVYGALEDLEWYRLRPPKVEFFGYANDPFVGDPNNEVIVGLQRNGRELWEHNITLNPVTGCCDLRHLRANGAALPIPSCLYGPGRGMNAHVANECVYLDQVEQVAKTVGAFLLDWFGN